MQSFRLDPYLWIHLAGLAALPILLEVCLLGLAVGYPLLPPVLEVTILAVIGIAPILWMQWTRPFYIFSLMAVALQPEKLSERQRQMLRFFKTPVAKGVALIAPIILTWALWQLYKLAPVAADFTPISSQLRIVGLLIAAIAFLACNLFLQVPLSVLHLLLVSPKAVENAEAYPVAEIPQNFTLIGLRIPRILPELKATPKPAPVDLPRRKEEQEMKQQGDDLAEPESTDLWDEGEGAIADLSEPEFAEEAEDAIADSTDADPDEEGWEETEGAIADLSEPEFAEEAEGAIADLSEPEFAEETEGAIADLSEPEFAEEAEDAIADLSDSESTEPELTEPEVVDSEDWSSNESEKLDDLNETAGEADEVYTAVDESMQVTDQVVEPETATDINEDDKD